jgi:serine/threonine protein kinase
MEIINAVEYVHSIGVAHRDLKPSNILLTSDIKIKLADFGLSNMYREGCKLTSPCGSPCYAAPEVIEGKAY